MEELKKKLQKELDFSNKQLGYLLNEKIPNKDNAVLCVKISNEAIQRAYIAGIEKAMKIIKED